jgi:hypothetical protein
MVEKSDVRENRVSRAKKKKKIENSRRSSV